MPKIVFFSPYGSWTVHEQVDAIIASALRERGVETKIVRCDGFFDNCYVLAHSKNKQVDCAACAKKGNDFFAAFGLHQMQLRERFDLVRLENLKRSLAHLDFDSLLAYQHAGAPLGREILPTVCSYFRVSWKHINDPRYLPLYREYLAYGVITFDVMTQFFQEWGATAVVMYNGVGYLHSPTFLAAKHLGLSIVCHERGAFDNSFVFSSNATIGRSAGVVAQKKAWQDIPLTNEELSRLQQYFVNREAGEISNLPAFQSFNTDPRTVRSYLNIPNDARIVSVFNSTEYEQVYAFEEHEGLPSQQAVLGMLIEIFRNRSEYLVIRHHPNIAGGRGGTPPEFDMLEWQFKQARDLPPNVRVIMPAEKLNSYALLWNSAAVISPHSSMRSDAIARGIPTAAFNHEQSRCAMTEVIKNAERPHLESIVENLLARSWSLTVEDMRDLYRTSCTFHFRNSVKFQSFGIKDNFLPLINITSFKELLPGRDPELDRICDHLLQGAPLLKQPDAMALNRSNKEETEFLSRELRRVQEERRSLLSQAIVSAGQKVPLLVLCVGASQDADIEKNFPQPRQVRLDVRTVRDTIEAATVISQSDVEFVVLASDRIQFDPSWFDYAVEELTKHPDKIAIQCNALSKTAALSFDKFPELKTPASVFRRTALLSKQGADDSDATIIDPLIRCTVT